ncbi:MAG: glycosyltransferase family 2 protein [Dehalococcoidia bacterium]|nr:glycosyltransferase family 2 protein [Dehalococcoidia bacterium]
MALVDVLIPTFERKTGLAMLLASLLGQSFPDFDVVVSDQTAAEQRYLESVEVQAAVAALRYHGHQVRLLSHLPRRGLAEQRQFLLAQSAARYVQYLDDDLLLEPGVMARMVATMRAEGCGFVGCAAAGLRFLGDVRPAQEGILPWEGPVRPEPFGPETIPWERHLVNNAANPLHLAKRLLEPEGTLRYRVAWVGGNILYDRAKLVDVGGFGFWPRLGAQHAGEEVVVQLLLLRYHGGCGLLPSGTYHLGLPTTVPTRDENAVALFGELIDEYETRLAGRATRERGAPGGTLDGWPSGQEARPG